MLLTARNPVIKKNLTNANQTFGFGNVATAMTMLNGCIGKGNDKLKTIKTGIGLKTATLRWRSATNTQRLK